MGGTHPPGVHKITTTMVDGTIRDRSPQMSAGKSRKTIARKHKHDFNTSQHLSPRQLRKNAIIKCSINIVTLGQM
uniref:Uncharacterized protein n=1 Tax=Leersia perrieri TaxID=77586 RepID=A0A0D9VBA2_9ORYZ